MSVFRTFWQVVRKYKATIILYTVLLIVFGGINLSSGDQQKEFVDSKPDILIVNQDQDSKLTDNLVRYIEQHSHQIKVDHDEEAINDALFYRDVNYVIYIPENYGRDTLAGNKPKLSIKSTGDYMASFSEMMLNRYLKLQTIYQTQATSEDELIRQINQSLQKSVDVTVSSSLDTSKLSNVSLYFNFATYSIMAVVIYVICLVISSFKENAVHKRTVISSMNYRKYNRQILFASCFYALIVWCFYILLGLILLGDVMFSLRGLMYMLNSFVFTFCALTLALLISTIVTDKNAVSGIVNTISLGCAFLCGAFVPAEWLPSSVLGFAHILPAYWYIHSNDLLKTIEVITLESVQPILMDCLVVIGFSFVFIIINNIVSKRQRES